MSDGHWLVAPIVLPFVLASVLLLLGSRMPKLASRLSLAGLFLLAALGDLPFLFVTGDRANNRTTGRALAAAYDVTDASSDSCTTHGILGAITECVCGTW